MNKKGQGLSLNVIIVAALALVVLVVLVMVFTGRIGIFSSELSKQANTELTRLQQTYDDCHPTTVEELNFKKEYATEDLAKQAQAVDDFATKISGCRIKDEPSCTEPCRWK